MWFQKTGCKSILELIAKKLTVGVSTSSCSSRRKVTCMALLEASLLPGWAPKSLLWLSFSSQFLPGTDLKMLFSFLFFLWKTIIETILGSSIFCGKFGLYSTAVTVGIQNFPSASLIPLCLRTGRIFCTHYPWVHPLH